MASPSNLTLAASASRTTTVTDTDRYNYAGHRGLIVVVDVTVAGTGSITPKLQYKDDLSGQYVDLVVAAAARTTTGQTILKVYPSVLDTASSPNANSNMVLPLIWRLVVTHNNANAMTWSAAALLLP